MAFNQNNIGRQNSGTTGFQQNQNDLQRLNSSQSSQQPFANQPVPGRMQKQSSDSQNFAQQNARPNDRDGRGNANQGFDGNQTSGYQNARQNDRDSRYNSNQGSNNARQNDPFESLIDDIRIKNVITLNQFFLPFDAYQSRILKLWELEIIFPSVQQETLKQVCEINQNEDALRNGEAKLQFIINRLYNTQGIKSIDIQSRPSLPEESLYMSKSVSAKVQEALIKMTEQRDIGHDPDLAFSKIFMNERSSQLTFSQLDSMLRTQCNHMIEKNDVIDVMTYFSHSMDTSSLNKINFVQGIKPWVEKKRPGSQQQYQFPGQNGFNQSQVFQNQQMGQPGVNPGQFQMQGQPQMMHQMQPPMSQPPMMHQMQPPMAQPQMMRPMQQPMAQNPMMQPIQQSINQNPIMQPIQQPMNQGNFYEQPNNQVSFTESPHNPMINGLSGQMPPQQIVQQAQPGQLAQEGQVFGQISQYFGTDLDNIVSALRQRKTGLFKHLSQHSRDGASQNLEEFSRSIDLLGLVSIPSNSRQQIFAQLAGLQGGGQVQISTFEALFKFQSTIKAPRINKDSVLQNIILAFNTDIPFIQAGLQRKGAQIESFVEFFEQFNGYQQFFTIEQIQIVAETYLFHNGMVNHQVFFGDIQRIQQSSNLQRQQNFLGIQNDTRVESQGPQNPLMPNMSQDCTKTATMGRQERPFYFVPPSDDNPVEEVIKGCYVINKLVEDYFVSFQKNGILSKLDFTAGVTSLRSSLQISQSERLFDEIDKVMSNNRPIGQITASTLDQYIHFACKISLTKLQENIMNKIVERVSIRNVNIQSQFQMHDNRNSSTIPLTTFIQILQDLDPSLRDNDLPFVAKKYSNGIDFLYVKFMDDFNQANRLYLAENKRALPEFIAEQLKKKLYLLQIDIQQFIKKHVKAQYVSQTDFTDIFGQHLELVPQICQMSALVSIFTQISRNGTATVDEVVRYFEMKCPRDHHTLKDDIIKQIRQHGSSIRQVIEKDRDFIQYGSMQISTLEAILFRDFKISSLDANFLANFYIKSGSVDVEQFLTEVSGNPTGAKNVKLNDILGAIKNAADNRRVQLAQEFGRHQVGRGNSISKESFFQEISKFFQLSSNEQNQIETSYESVSNSREIDHIRFLEDLRGATKETRRTNVVYTREQERAIADAKKELSASEVGCHTLVRSLTYQDPQNRGYLSMAKMQQAFKETSNVKSRQGTVILHMSEQQANIIIGCCETDSKGDFNYNQLLDEIVGRAQVNQILSQNQVISPSNALGQASSQRFSEIAKRLFPKQKLVEEQIVKMSRQKINGVPLISEQDFGAILLQSGVQLTVDERQDLQNLFNRTRDGQGLNNPISIFKELGVVPLILGQGTSKTAPKPKLLSDQDLRACQDLINEVRRDIKAQGRQPEQMVQNVTGTSIGPADFMKTLKAETTESVRVKLTNQAVGNLMHYLFKDESGRVNVKKLLQALQLPEREPPLKQDGVEEVTQYMNALERKITNSVVPFPIYELNQFMRSKNNMSLGQLLQLQQNAINSDMLVTTFEEKLQEQGFVPKDRNELFKSIQDKSTGTNKVSISTLQKFLKELAPKVTDSKGVKEKYGRMNNIVRNNISQISQYMQRNNIPVEVLHKQLDINNDGSVDKHEFVEGIYSLMKPCPITNKDLGDIFDQIDINGDHYLSVNEFALFLEGAKMTSKQKIDRMDPRLVEDVTRQISDLFRQLDSRSTGFITHIEIFTTMKGLKQQITEDKAKEMIKKVDLDGDGRITLEELVTLLRPVLLEELVSKENSVEEIRAMFKEADTDYSGFLSIDEMYACMLKMGVNVSKQEIVKLFMEFDINGDMQIDIDEFVAIMSFGDEIQFNEQENVSTYMKIKQARKINVLDFAKIFNSLPQSFVPSFYAEQWQSSKKNLPSSGLKAQIDPKTMGWKDMLPLLTEQMTAEYQKQGIKVMRPIPTTLGCQIVIESAEGVPLPAEGKDFDRQNIVKRVVRVGLFDTVKQELIFNSAHVVAKWESSSEDIWTMLPQEQSTSLNPLLLRTTKNDDLDKVKVVLVFELVVYVKNGKKTTEMSCGWSQLELNQCERELTKVKLEIKGGTPMNQIRIEDGDIHTKRSGMKGLLKMFNSNIKSTLIVTIQPMSKIDDATRTHMEFLPSTCVVNKKLVSFVSGYRNYAAEILIRGSTGGSMKKPAGDVVMSTFPKIMDCPDVLEILAMCWTEDFIEKRSAVEKRSIELAVTKIKDYIQRLYPVFYAEDFGYQLSNITESACGDPQKMTARQTLTTSALRYNNKDAKKTVSKPPQTSYKPFNIREIEFEIWEDGHAQKQEGFMRKFDQAGVIAAPGI